MSLFVKSQVQKKMEECVMDAITHSVEVLSKEYGFDMKEGITLVLGSGLGLGLNVEKSVGKVSKVSKGNKGVNSLIMCFDERNVKENGCNGLKYNGGLFTQCDVEVKKDGCGYCEVCSKEAEEHGKPLCGTVKERIEMGSSFEDSKGRKAIKYLRYLKKEKKSVDEAKEIASSEGWYLPEGEVSDVKVVKEKRGRPKKDIKEVATEKVVDIFACMVEEVSTSSIENEKENDMMNELTESMVKLSVEKKTTPAAEKKAQEKALKEQEKALKEQEKLLEKEKKAQEKALKEQEKLLKEQEKEKKAQEKEKKAQEKALKEQEKEKKVQEKEKKVQEKEKKEAVVEEKVKVQVSKFTYEGKEYYKTSNNLVYDPVTKEEVGIYCDETKTIKELPDDSDSEIEEEEYDE